jgi:hypothetical protein
MTQQGILFGCAAFLAVVALAPPHQEEGPSKEAKIKRAMALKGAMAIAVGILVAIAASIH